VHLVFDTSAVLAYAQGAIAPGELLMTVAEEVGGTVGVPVTCLAEAYAGAKEGVEESLVDYLANAVPTVAVLPLAPLDAQAVGHRFRQASLGMAHAAVISLRFDVDLATLDGALARRLGLDPRRIIDL
jgi:hypothetical protein